MECIHELKRKRGSRNRNKGKVKKKKSNMKHLKNMKGNTNTAQHHTGKGARSELLLTQ